MKFKIIDRNAQPRCNSFFDIRYTVNGGEWIYDTYNGSSVMFAAQSASRNAPKQTVHFLVIGKDGVIAAEAQ